MLRLWAAASALTLCGTAASCYYGLVSRAASASVWGLHCEWACVVGLAWLYISLDCGVGPPRVRACPAWVSAGNYRACL